MSVSQEITGIRSQRAGENKPPAVKFAEARTRRPLVVAGSSCGPFPGVSRTNPRGFKDETYLAWHCMSRPSTNITPMSVGVQTASQEWNKGHADNSPDN